MALGYFKHVTEPVGLVSTDFVKPRVKRIQIVWQVSVVEETKPVWAYVSARVGMRETSVPSAVLSAPFAPQRMRSISDRYLSVAQNAQTTPCVLRASIADESMMAPKYAYQGPKPVETLGRITAERVFRSAVGTKQPVVVTVLRVQPEHVPIQWSAQMPTVPIDVVGLFASQLTANFRRTRCRNAFQKLEVRCLARRMMIVATDSSVSTAIAESTPKAATPVRNA